MGVYYLFNLHLFKKRKEHDEDINEIIKQIQKTGESYLRGNFILKYEPFIIKCVSKTIGKYVEVENCDEYSIGLMAFNEAIDTYDHRSGRNFFNFAEQVIRRRLINYYRINQKRKNTVPVISFEDGEFDRFEEGSLKVDQIDYFWGIEAKDQMLKFQTELGKYGISFDELILNGPKHKDSRNKLIEIGKILAENGKLYSSLVKTGNIPLSELMKLVKVSQRTIERNRKFIIAVCIVFNGELDILRDYVTDMEKGGEMHE